VSTGQHPRVVVFGTTGAGRPGTDRIGTARTEIADAGDFGTGRSGTVGTTRTGTGCIGIGPTGTAGTGHAGTGRIKIVGANPTDAAGAGCAQGGVRLCHSTDLGPHQERPSGVEDPVLRFQACAERCGAGRRDEPGQRPPCLICCGNGVSLAGEGEVAPGEGEERVGEEEALREQFLHPLAGA
jgi:hypothetical protein